MAGQDGALGASFKIVRMLQVISLLSCIGMAANFISEMITANDTPSRELVGTLSVTCIAVLYCAITIILHFDGILPYLINTATDGLMLIALIVVATVVGKPLAYLDCKVIGSSSVAESTSQLGAELNDQLHHQGDPLAYSNWIGASKSTCYEMKAIWGLSIALCILFCFSAMCSVCLWRRSRMSPPQPWTKVKIWAVHPAWRNPLRYRSRPRIRRRQGELKD